MGEFERIAKFLAPLSGHGAHGLKDDTALLEPYIVSTDTLIEGVHFLCTDTPKTIAQKLIAVNLSDLASKGSPPYAYTLNITLPHDTKDGWFADFSQGLAIMQHRYNIHLLGGDTTHHDGGIVLSATLFGHNPKYIPLRCNAKVGDIVCITGGLGAGSFGLLACTGYIESDTLSHYYRCPEPHVKQGIALGAYANAMTDVSDGLLADLGHVAKASSVNITLVHDRVPVHSAVMPHKAAIKDANARIFGGGDDYVLALTLTKDRVKSAKNALHHIDKDLHTIGTVNRGSGVVVLNNCGEAITFQKKGYEHGQNSFR